MLTPQEIQDKKFEKARFGGYDMTQIDDFLDVVLADYTALYKENAVLKGKMRVLVDKIEEYRSVDEQMRKALYAAQVSARDIVSKAQSEADAIMKNANSAAEAQVGDLRRQIDAEERRLAAAKESCNDYARRISAMLSKNIEAIQLIMDTPADTLVPPSAQPVRDTAAYAGNIQRAARPHDDLREEKRPGSDLTELTDRGAQQTPAAPERVERTPERIIQEDDMETQYYNIDLSEKKADEPYSREGGKRAKEEESDTARIYGDSIFTPKPRFDFSDLKFGPNYHGDDNKE